MVGGIIFGSIGVFAATYFSASQISYTPSDETWDVTNVEEATNSLYTDLKTGKELIANAITGKGISTSNTDSFSTMASNIESLSTEAKPVTLTYKLTRNKWINGQAVITTYHSIDVSGFTKLTINDAYAYTTKDGSNYVKIDGTDATTLKGQTIDISSKSTINIVLSRSDGPAANVVLNITLQ